MPSDEQMRDMLKKAYPFSRNWAKKVDKMPDKQVAAVYLRLLDQNKLSEE